MIAVIALVGMEHIERQVREQSVNSLQTVLDATEESINEIWLHGLFADLENWASDPVVFENTRALLAAERNQDTLIFHPAQQQLRDYLRGLLQRNDARGMFIIV